MSKRNQPQEYAIIGLGHFGTSLARTLEMLGSSVLAIDKDPVLVQAIADEVTQAATLDATHEDALKAIDILSFSTVIVAIGEDFESSLLIVSSLKTLGVKKVVAKARTDRQRNILQRIGADRVVQPEQSAGRRLAYELNTPMMLERLPIGRGYSLVEVHAPRSVTNQTLLQSDIRNRYDVSVLLIQRGDELIVSPTPNTILQQNDVLFILGSDEAISTFCTL